MASKAYAGSRVLVVEDEVLIGMVLEDILDMLGCRLAGYATSLTEAVVAAGTELDLAILDVNLGGDSSFGLADELRARGVSVIFATGAAADSLPDRFRDCAVLETPYTFASVEAALDKVFGPSTLAAAS